MRQDGGDYVDTLYPVLSWLTPMSIGKWTLEGVETRAQLLDSDGLLRQQQDPYAFIRNAYFQRNDFLASGGKLKPEENPNASAIQDDLKRYRLPVNNNGDQQVAVLPAGDRMGRCTDYQNL